MKTVLVYGDSNAWGLIPATKFERYDFDTRWPGMVQNILGDEVRIIEENLCARTIDSDDLRPGFEGRNGMTELPMVLDSHYPFDVIIISLGLNELKSIYDWTPSQVADKLRAMVELVRSRKPNFHDHEPVIMLMTQPIVKHTGQWGELWVGAEDASRRLHDQYVDLAKEASLQIVDVSDIPVDSLDGVHWDSEGHSAVAERVAHVLRV